MSRPSASPESIRRLIDRIRDPAYWSGLVPELRIERPSRDSPIDESGLATLDQVTGHFEREGYFAIDRLLKPASVGRLRLAVERLHEAGCPLAFAFVYDEFWESVTAMAPLLERFLGQGFRQLPDFWVWRIDPSREDAGWRPHRDKGFASLRPDGSPKSLTVWTALTDVTPVNGCIYLVPAHLDPPSRYVTSPDLRMPASLQDVRAIPVPAGSVLGWNQALLHWGGRASRRGIEPRISFACEFQRGDVEPFNRPLLEVSSPPPFDLRIALVGKQLLQYRHMYGLPEALAAVGEQIAAGLGG